MSRLKLPTEKHIAKATEDTGSCWYVYVALYGRDGKQWGAMHGCAGRPFAGKVGDIILTDPDVLLAENPPNKKAKKR